MPTYEYRCPRGHAFDVFLPIKQADAPQKCPTCKRRGRRQFSAGAGAMCKGKGFYSTDNRTTRYKSDQHMHTEMAKMEKRLDADKL